MKRGIRTSVAVICALVLAAVLVAGASAKKDPFIGKWHSTDVDGSYQTLEIGGGPGNTYHFRYHDDAATLCGLGPGDVILYAATAKGILEADGNFLSGNRAIYCLENPPVFLGDFGIDLTYDPLTDTMTEPGPIVWMH